MYIRTQRALAVGVSEKDSINHHTSELSLLKREYERKEVYKNEHISKRN